MKSSKKISDTKMEIAGPPKSQLHTIKKENIFTENTHFKHFYTEAPCTEYLSTLPALHQFGEDVDTVSGKKQFYAINYDAIYLLSKSKKYHLYEYYGNNELLKLFLDIDIKNEHIPENANRQQFFDDTLHDSISLITQKLQDHDIEKPEIIILKSSSDAKLSAHIIFPDVRFENIREMKFFMSDIDNENDLIKKGIMDNNVYKKGCLRVLHNSKASKNVILEYYKSYNYKYTNEKNLFMDCLITNINRDYFEVKINIPTNVKINKVIQNKPNTKSNTNAKTNTKINNTDKKNIRHQISSLASYVNILSQKRTEIYGEWLKIGMILHNCNPSEECFNLWDKWSKLSENYESKDYNAYKWNSFKDGHYTIASLKHFAKEDNPDAYPTISHNLDVPIFEAKEFECKYLLNSVEENIKDNTSFVSKHVNNWVSDVNIKTLAIRSPYNTGKTKLIKKIIKEFDFKRVLFISYRQTLSQDLFGNFKLLHVKTYLNGAYHAERLICQIESLHNILPEMMFNEDGDENTNDIPQFDLIILDEIESVLNHFLSTTIKDKEHTFNIMTGIIYNSGKILALDGDFYNRSYEFLKFFGNMNILNNKIKKDIKHYIFVNNRPYFDNLIYEDLKDGKNVVIVSMSSKIATYLYNHYKDKYNCILHCSKSSDCNKKELENVNEFWSGSQLLLYSPSIEAGVNFSEEHFDSMYVVLSSKSTSPRGLNQMIARPRYLKNKNIFVYLNNIPFKTDANFFKYDEIKGYVCDIYGTYKKPQIKLDTERNKMVAVYDFDLYVKILIHNELERANKTTNLFVAYLIKLLIDKGHTFSHSEIRHNNNALKKDTLLKDEIFNGIDIDEYTYKDLFKKVCCNEAMREDKIAIEKFNIKKDWKVTEITDDFLCKFYGKTEMLYNLRFLLDESLVVPHYLNKDNTYRIVFDKVSKLEQIKMIKEIVLGLGFEVPISNKLIKRDIFMDNIKTVLAQCQLFTNINKSQPLFGFDKTKLVGDKVTVKQFMGFMNSVLGEWGIIIKTVKKYKHIIIDGKRKTESDYFYALQYIDNINVYI